MVLACETENLVVSGSNPTCSIFLRKGEMINMFNEAENKSAVAEQSRSKPSALEEFLKNSEEDENRDFFIKKMNLKPRPFDLSDRNDH